jgi:hypothetical protein
MPHGYALLGTVPARPQGSVPMLWRFSGDLNESLVPPCMLAGSELCGPVSLATFL